MENTSIELKEKTINYNLVLKPFDNTRLLSLCGYADDNLRYIEQRLNIEILNRSDNFQLIGTQAAVATAKVVLQDLYQQTKNNKNLTSNQVHLSLQQALAAKHKTIKATEKAEPPDRAGSTEFSLKTPQGTIRPRSKAQAEYAKKIQNHAMTFAIGPAGTGKTFLAAACAVSALQQQKVRRIILVRPVVEAGENLGFLPGDLFQKIDPYLRPLYDSLYQLLGHDKVLKLIEQETIEIAPLAFMRGRTLNDAFIILDEGQNATDTQMQMFLTRVGFSSTVVITGDITQIDLPKHKQSGLIHCSKILKDIPEICFIKLTAIDVVRHPIVQKIIDAYAKDSKKNSQSNK